MGFTKHDVDNMNTNKARPRPSVAVVNRNGSSLQRVKISEGKSSESDQVGKKLDDVFDTLGTDEVESQYFVGQHSGSQMTWSRKHVENYSSRMSLNEKLESVSSSSDSDDAESNYAGDKYAGNSHEHKGASDVSLGFQTHQNSSKIE